MKKSLALLLVLCLALCGCSELIPAKTTVESQNARLAAQAAATTAPTTQPTTVPTTEATTEPPTEPAPVYLNPLNGEILDEPFNKRIFAVSINNIRDAVPHSNVGNADLYFETFVNGSIIRGLALFTDPSGMEAIGPVRSNRMVFNDLCRHYDAVMVHAGADYRVIQDCENQGLDNFNIDAWGIMDLTSFRDSERSKAGYGWEHTLFAIGDGLIEYSLQNGIRMEVNPDVDYQLLFADDGMPAGGVEATDINITITVNQYKKDTRMVYDPSLDKYVYNQYDQEMVDERSGEKEAFRNVLILTGTIPYDGPFQRPDLLAGGEGWFACGGKAVPITWGSDSQESPLWFRTADGEPLVLGRGNTYIAITQTGSAITGIGE
ncbi:MAG: DUF3048 domain-containing protein [Faecousia sp.]